MMIDVEAKDHQTQNVMNRINIEPVKFRLKHDSLSFPKTFTEFSEL